MRAPDVKVYICHNAKWIVVPTAHVCMRFILMHYIQWYVVKAFAYIDVDVELIHLNLLPLSPRDLLSFSITLTLSIHI